jgi:plastocyanin
MSRSPLLTALAATLLVLGAGACGSGSDEGSAGSGGAASKTIQVVETEFELTPATVTIAEPGTYTFRAVNRGGTVHALEIEGPGVEEKTQDIQPGGSAELTVEIGKAGEYEIYCPVDGHREQGMEGTVEVAGAAGGGATTGKTTTEDDSGDGGYGY